MEGRPDLVQTLQGAFMEVRLNFPAADVAIFHDFPHNMLLMLLSFLW